MPACTLRTATSRVTADRWTPRRAPRCTRPPRRSGDCAGERTTRRSTISAEMPGTEPPTPASAELQDTLSRAIESLEANPAAAAALRAAPAVLRNCVPFVFSCSEFVAQACIRDAALLEDVFSRY